MTTNGNQKGIFQVGGTAAVLAVLALLATFVAFGMAGVMGGEGAEKLLTLISQKRLVFVVAFIAVSSISLFDIFTVPGLYTISKDGSHSLALSATILAIVGDIFGLIGGLIQAGLVRLSTGFESGTDLSGILANARLIENLELSFTSAGFLLVGPSFLFFGVALLKSGFSKWLGWVGIAAGILTIIGLIPPLALISLVANLFYLVWYILVSVRFFKMVG